MAEPYFKCIFCLSFFHGDPTPHGNCQKCGSNEGFKEVDENEALDILAQFEWNPVSTLIPNGDQERWIKMIGSHVPGVKPRTKVLSAPNKIGKSASTIAALANIIWGKQSLWFDYPIYTQEWPFPKVCWFASWESALKEILIPEMFKWFPKERYEPTKEGKHFHYHWVTDNGWHIYVKSYDQGDTAFESSLCGLVIFSEPPPESIYNAIPARLSQGGIILIEQTPVPKMNPAWLYDVLEDEGKAEFLYSEMGLEVNCKEHGIRGHLSHRDIEEMIDGYSWEEKHARVTGKPMNLTGAAFKRFNEQRQVVPTREIGMNEQVWMVMDPHDRKPPFVSWYAINPALDIRCIFEFPVYKENRGYEKITGTTLRIKDFVECICVIEKEHGFGERMVRRIMDPYFGSKEYSDTRFSVVQTYNKYLRENNQNEVLFTLGPRQEIGYGLDLIRDKIDYQVRTDDQPGFNPKLTFERHCMNNVRAMRRYSFVDTRKNRDDQELASAKKQTERWKHAIDVLRYLLASNPYYEYDRNPGIRKPTMQQARDIFANQQTVQTSWKTR